MRSIETHFLSYKPDSLEHNEGEGATIAFPLVSLYALRQTNQGARSPKPAPARNAHGKKT